MTKEAMTKGELAMMGIVMPVINNKEAIEITDYILKTLVATKQTSIEDSGTEILDNQINRYGKNQVRHIVVNTIHDMVMITYTLEGDGDEEPFPEDLTTQDGVFSYVLNLTVPMFSELGYTFYEKRQGGNYYRIG
mgnify:CR=1 FL=1